MSDDAAKSQSKLTLRLDPEELAAIKDSAEARKMSVQAYALSTLLRDRFAQAFQDSVADTKRRYGSVLADVDDTWGDPGQESRRGTAA